MSRTMTLSSDCDVTTGTPGYYHQLFQPERMKTEKVKKLVANLHDKTENVIHIRNSKQALNHRIFLKKIP